MQANDNAMEDYKKLEESRDEEGEFEKTKALNNA